MKKLLNTLREQHQTILEMLNKPELAKELIHFVEKEHHPLEELELFPFLQTQRCLTEGGPRCSFFMGIRLEFAPLQIIKEHLKKIYLKTSFRPPDYPIPLWLSPQSPISIPFEEHVVGAELAHVILYLLKSENSQLSQEFFSLLYSDYCGLLKMHIDKEDNCLFIMCERVLT